MGTAPRTAIKRKSKSKSKKSGMTPYHGLRTLPRARSGARVTRIIGFVTTDGQGWARMVCFLEPRKHATEPFFLKPFVLFGKPNPYFRR